MRRSGSHRDASKNGQLDRQRAREFAHRENDLLELSLSEAHSFRNAPSTRGVWESSELGEARQRRIRSNAQQTDAEDRSNFSHPFQVHAGHHSSPVPE